MALTPITKEYLEQIKSNVKIGDVVFWKPTIAYVDDFSRGYEPVSATVKAKYEYFCITDKGTIPWIEIAMYAWNIANGKVRYDDNRR